MVVNIFLFFLSVQSFCADWRLIDSSMGISVWESDTEGTPLSGVKGETIIDAPLNRVLYVLADVERSQEWLDGLKNFKVLERNGPLETVIHQEFSLPWPVTNRDFVFRGRAYKKRPGQWAIEIKSENHPLSPKTSAVRGEILESRYLLTAQGLNKTKLEVEIICDPKGNIPIWLVNLIQKKWPRKTLSALKEQVKKPYILNASLPDWI